jgi:hypothetical protein
VEVRSPHSSVVAALAFNPGRALGFGPLLGSGYEVVGPQPGDVPGLVSVRRERLMLDLPRVSTFDSAVKRAVSARIDVCPDTGLTAVSAERAHGGRVGLLVGLTPIAPYRTVVRWRLRIDGRGASALVAAASTGWKLRSRTGRAARAFEATADAAETVRDTTLELLQQKGQHP